MGLSESFLFIQNQHDEFQEIKCFYFATFARLTMMVSSNKSMQEKEEKQKQDLHAATKGQHFFPLYNYVHYS